MEPQGVVRVARVDDAKAIGVVHVDAWQAAYRGIMPDEYLNGLRATDRSAQWGRWLATPPSGTHIVVIEGSGTVVGFASCGVERGSVDDPTVGELYAINLSPTVWGQGFGRELLAAATQVLAHDGYAAAILWVVPQNDRARRFYERAGWTDDGTARVETVQGATVDEVRYRRNLAQVGSTNLG
ncbi:GNAT family N-acetyltransferase [soil metagenome]